MSLWETKKKDGCKGLKDFRSWGSVSVQILCLFNVCVCVCVAVWYGVGAAVDVTKTQFLPFLSLISYLHTHR